MAGTEKETVARAHVIIGWTAIAASFAVSMFGLAKLAIKSTGQADGDVLPGAWLHGYFGQFAWLFGTINVALGAKMWWGETAKGTEAAVIVLVVLIILLTIARLYLVPTSVQPAPKLKVVGANESEGLLDKQAGSRGHPAQQGGTDPASVSVEYHN